MKNTQYNHTMEFEEAALRIRQLKSIPTHLQLNLYGLYKQATCGPCTDPAPGLLDFRGRAKWSAWRDVGSLSCGEAQEAYVQLVRDILERDRGSERQEGEESFGGGPGGGVFSKLMPESGEDATAYAILKSKKVFYFSC